MKKKIFLFLCLSFFGCGKEKLTRDMKLQQGLETKTANLSSSLKKIYSNSERLSYYFKGDENAITKTFITGKELVIPILYENVGEELVLNIAILLNLETQSKQVFIDNLLADYTQFKNIITKSTKWIYKTDEFSSKFLLEKSLKQFIDITFPQNNEKKKFEAFMIFDGERNFRDLVLKEIEFKESQTIISFKRNKVIFLNDKIMDEFIQGAVFENYQAMMNEIGQLEKAYSDLDKLLKSN